MSQHIANVTLCIGDKLSENINCLCSGTTVSRHLLARDEATGALFTYLRCARCGLERLSPRPLLCEMGKYYPDDYTPYEPPGPAISRVERLKQLVYWTFWSTPAERPAAVRRLRWLLKAVLWPLRRHSVLSFSPPSERRVFEFGAGSGGDLLVFHAAGWEVSGCEPSQHACRVAARSGLALANSAAEQAAIPDGVTCVYMNNVFEHLHDPRAVLARSRAALAPGGLLVLVVPNHNAWAARLFGADWPGYDAPRHLWGYSPDPLRTLLREAGFEIVSLSHKFPLSSYCWGSGIAGCRALSSTRRRWRIRAARILRPVLVAAAALAAMCRHGDYLHVVARKSLFALPQNAQN